MFASTAGLARLFMDNFYGNGAISYDMGYPRQQTGDDPFPDPSQNSSTSNATAIVYAGNMTYVGCYTDQSPATLPYKAYSNPNNTVEMCTGTCVAAGYAVAGLEYGAECYCGTALTYAAVKTVESGCSYVCAGECPCSAVY